MNILYGIQGTGNGHVTRSTQIIDCLQQKGAVVDVIFSGCGPDKIFDKQTITSPGFYKGFTFSAEQGKIRLLHTALNLSVGQFIKDVWNFDAAPYDLVITDFEPVSAMVARKNRLPSIGIGHQYAFCHAIPMDRATPFSRLIMNRFAPADLSIGLHWHHFDAPILPPVIPDPIRRARRSGTDIKSKEHILVYLPFEHPDDIEALVRSFKDYQFVVYDGEAGRNRQNTDTIRWNPFSRSRFLTDLAQSSGVLCNAGFELPSEALFLGKKLLVKPLEGQFEQASNALALTMLGLGTTMTRLDPQILGEWLETDRSVTKEFNDTAGRLADWIIAGDFSDMDTLVSECWKTECLN